MISAFWLKDYGFAHGACTLAERLGVTFYFRDLDMGASAPLRRSAPRTRSSSPASRSKKAVISGQELSV